MDRAVILSLRLSRLGVMTGIGVLAFLPTAAGADGAPGITYIGTNGPNTHRGTAGPDRLYGRGGNDVLRGLAGADLIVGGPGSDRLSGGRARDLIHARDGARDFVNCGPGRDRVVVDNVDVVRHCEAVLRPSARTGTLRHPIPIGAPAALGDGWRLRVVKATPNATERILDYDPSNNPPARGRQFFMVTVSARRTAKRPARLHAGFRFRAVGYLRNEYTTFQDSCGVLPDPDLEIEDPKVFHGGRLSGNICWEVRKKEARSLVMYNAGGRAGGRLVFFALR